MAKMSGIELPEGSKFLRKIPLSKTDDADFVAAFDRHTLFYDVFHDPETGEITMVGPSLRSQKRFFSRARLAVDGEAVEDYELTKISARTGQIVFPSPTRDPRELTLSHPAVPALAACVPVNRAEPARFAGRNALVAISKNNKLSWIKDWLFYYVTQHGADAVVLIDNGSDAYSVETLLATIASVEGIEAAEVISAPYPFGPRGVDREAINSKFLHLSAMHVAHRRFLKHANAVLSVDIDELVTKPGDRTVFEAVKDTPQGFLSIKGTWRYAPRPEDAQGEVRHADHVLRRIGKDARMQPKWCVDPRGPLAGNYWRVHGIVGANRSFAEKFHYLHCRQITTNWDYDRDFEPIERFEQAPEAGFVQAAFGG